MPVNTNLEDKVIVVTGGTRGIGLEIVKELAKNKAHIIFTYRDKSKAEEVFQEIEKLGGSAQSVYLDMTNISQSKDLIDLVKGHGRLDGLVNNAGISVDQLLLRLKESDVEKVLTVNLKSVMLLTSQLTRYLMKSDASSVVNIGSVVGLMGNVSQAVYSASKAGLVGFTKSVAKEMGSKNLRCNIICPGFVETDMTEELSEERKQMYLDQIPLKRMGKAEDVAKLTLFLLSSASSYMTGQVLKIDGGLYI